MCMRLYNLFPQQTFIFFRSLFTAMKLKTNEYFLKASLLFLHVTMENLNETCKIFQILSPYII